VPVQLPSVLDVGLAGDEPAVCLVVHPEMRVLDGISLIQWRIDKAEVGPKLLADDDVGDETFLKVGLRNFKKMDLETNKSKQKLLIKIET
jgi:hypothetical protein